MLNYRETILVSQDQFDALNRVREGFLQQRDNYDNPRPFANASASTGMNFPASSSGRNNPNYRVAANGEIPGTLVYEMNEMTLIKS